MNLMHLKVLLPFDTYIDCKDIDNIVVETTAGSYGLLPNRCDCVAALTSGILSFTSVHDGEVFVALNEGVLVKTGKMVQISVRRATIGNNLVSLRNLIEEEFMLMDEQAEQARAAMMKLENSFLHRFVNFQELQ